MRLGEWRNRFGFEDLKNLLSLLDWLVAFNELLFLERCIGSHDLQNHIGEEDET